MTYRYIAYNLQSIFQKAKDDPGTATIPQIVYWVQVVANRMRFEELEFNKNNSGTFLSTFSPVPVKIDTELKDRKYIEVPGLIMDLPEERGVEYITYNLETCCCDGPAFAQVTFSRTKPGRMRSLYGDPYTKPESDNPYFYRIGGKVNTTTVDRLYLLGLECIDVRDVEICVKSALNPKDVCSLDDDLPLPDHREEELMTRVLEIGRFSLLIPKERVNDGDDTAAIPQVKAPETQQVQQPEE